MALTLNKCLQNKMTPSFSPGNDLLANETPGGYPAHESVITVETFRHMVFDFGVFDPTRTPSQRRA